MIEPLFAFRLTCDACNTFCRHETTTFNALVPATLGSASVDFSTPLPEGWFEHTPHTDKGHFDNWPKRFVSLLWLIGVKPDLSHDGKQWRFLLCPNCSRALEDYTKGTGGVSGALKLAADNEAMP